MLNFNLLTNETPRYKIHNVPLHTMPLVEQSQIVVHLGHSRMHGVWRFMSYVQKLSSQIRLRRYDDPISKSQKTCIIDVVLSILLNPSLSYRTKGLEVWVSRISSRSIV